VSKAPRRLIPVSEDLVDRIIRISEKLGVPFRDLLESLISSVLDIVEYDMDMARALEIIDALWDLIRISGVLLPREAVYRIIDAVSDSELEEIMRILKHACRWYAELSRLKRGASLRDLKILLSAWFPDASIDIRSSPTGAKIVISSMNYSERVLCIVREVAVEFLRSLGYRVVSAESGEGIVSLVVEIGSREESA